MTESEFNDLAELTLISIEETIEALQADIDFDNINDVLTLEFDNGSQIIINKQTPARQIWVAARSGGYYFDYDESSKSWQLSNDSGKDLFQCLGQYCSEQAGQEIILFHP